MRYDEVRNTYAKFMNDVCVDVEVEPKLKALEGESFDDISTSIEDEDPVDVQACRLGVQILQNVF